MNKELPLCLQADQDKLVACYDSNKVVIYDLLNHRLHDWSKRNKFPQNYLNRYNRIVGIAQLTPKKFILYSHYTYITLNLALDVPTKEVMIIQNHPGKTLEEKSLAAKSWFESLKLSQGRYLKEGVLPEQKQESSGDEVPNLTISNKLKGILSMEYDAAEKKLVVVENVWKKLVQAFPGTVAIPKYGL